MAATGTTLEEYIVKILFKSDDDSYSDVESTATKLASSLKSIVGVVTAVFVASGVADFVEDSLEAASTAEQMQQKFDAVFTGIEDEADAWAESLADSIGRSKNDIKTYMADIQNLLVGMGMEREAGAELTEQMVEAAINIASFNNIEDETAINAMSKALLGETESAKTLGAVLNDNTLATAMQTLGLEGEFSALDEVTKMQVRYQAIVNQSADALREEDGVVGDAALSMDSYESRLRSFNAIIEDIYINVGTAILPIANKVLAFVSDIMTGVRDFTESLNDLNTEGGFLSGTLNILSKALNGVLTVIRAIYNIGSAVVDFFGGLDNVLQLISGTIGVILAYQLISHISNITKAISGVGSILSKINLKILAIIAVAAAVFLVIEDIVGFIQGKDSLIGDILESAGVDIEALRETISGVMDKVSEFGASASEAFQQIGSGISDFWSEYGPIIGDALYTVFASLVAVIGGVVEAIGPFVSAIISFGDALADLLNGDWSGAAEGFTAAWESLVDTVVGFIDGLNTTLYNMLGIDLVADMQQWATDMVDGFISGISGFLSKVQEAISPVTDWIASVLGHSTPTDGPLAGDDEWGADFISNFTSGIEGGTGALQAAVNTAADALASIGSGVLSGVSGIISGLTGTTVNASSTETITAEITDYTDQIAAVMDTDSYNTDRIMESVSAVVNALTTLTAVSNIIADATSGSIAPTVTQIASTVTNIQQTNSFSNTFNGGTTESQTAAASAMESNTSDATAYLADALAYGR